jgi:hypothetical protein
VKLHCLTYRVNLNLDGFADKLSRPLILRILIVYQNFGTQNFRLLFPKSVHKGSVRKRIYRVAFVSVFKKIVF